MPEPTPEGLRRMADRMRGKAMREENEAAEHSEAGNEGLVGAKLESAQRFYAAADRADDRADELEEGE